MEEGHLHEILMEVDINKNGEVDMGEFLQVLTHAPFGRVMVAPI